MTELLPADLLPEGLTPAVLVLVLAAALAAGFVDAVVGGGGLLQLPALFLVVPTAPPEALLGTNKAASVVGTAAAAVTYARRLPPARTLATGMVAAAAIGAAGGAASVSLLRAELVRPLVLGLLVVVWLFTLLRPEFGVGDRTGPSARRGRAIAWGGAAVIGFYDGFLGPGTGSFLIFLLVAGLGQSFLRASGTAKLVNVATNLAALALFVAHDAVLWELGLPMAAANLLGGVAGSRLALARGARFVRIVFLVVVAALIVRLGVDVI
jgi:hypothetical protein